MGNTQATPEEIQTPEYKKKVYDFLHPDIMDIKQLSGYADQICTSITNNGENCPMGDFDNINYNEIIYKFNMTSWGNLAYVVLHCKDGDYKEYMHNIMVDCFRALKEERDANNIDVDNDINFLGYVKNNCT